MSLEAGQRLLLWLGSNPMAGDNWTRVELADTVLARLARTLDGGVYAPPEDCWEGLVCTGFQKWEFTAERPGQAVLRMVNIHSSEFDQQPVESFEVRVIVR